MIIALVHDLLFTSKIRETAATLGVPVESFRALDAMLPRAAAASLAFVHLKSPDGADAVRALRAAAPALRIIAFGPHTAEDALEAARAAGADAVLTHGQVSKQLPSLIQSFAPRL